MESLNEMRESYYDYIEQKRRGYEITAKMIGYIIEKMQNAKIISQDIIISGRIKSFKSVCENIGKKAVDDYFGIRIIGNRKDLEQIEERISKILVVDSVKDHRKRKDTKYNGIHEMVHMDRKYAESNGIDSNLFPEIEIQYWDEKTKEQCLYGELSYANYKSKDLLEIINRLNREPEETLKDLPICYEIEGNTVNILTPEETLYRLYPEIKQLEEKKRAVLVKEMNDEIDK